MNNKENHVNEDFVNKLLRFHNNADEYLEFKNKIHLGNKNTSTPYVKYGMTETCYWELDDNLKMARTACSNRHPLNEVIGDALCPYCGKEIAITNEEKK